METVIFVPGLLCDETFWVHAVADLSSDYDYVVADVDTQDSITSMAADALALRGGPISVAGHSMGARVAMEMHRLAPDRIRRLALLDTGMHPRAEGEAAKRQARIDLAHRAGMRVLAADWLPPMVHPARHDDTELMGRLTEMVAAKTPEIHERQIRALLGRPDARPHLKAITCPTLLAVGRQDQWSPLAEHEAMRAELPNAELVVIEDAGHFAPVERPAAVTAALRAWLAR